MRILLVQLASVFRGEDTVYPLGLVRLASALAPRHEVQLLDQNLPRVSPAALAARAAAFRPDLVGLSFRNVDNTVDERSHVSGQKKTVRALRTSLGAGVPFVAGGSAFTLFAEEILRAIPEIAFGVRGYGEGAMTVLADGGLDPRDVPGAVWRQGPGVAGTAAPATAPPAVLGADVARLLDPAPYLAAGNRYFPPLGVETKRGCPRRCAYCAYPVLQSSSARPRADDDALAEMETFAALGARALFLVDPVANEPVAPLRRLVEGMARRVPGLKWHAWFREPGLILPDLQAFVSGGLATLSFSGDGLTDPELDLLGKDMTVEDILRAASLAARFDVPTVYHFFDEVPGDDPVRSLPEKLRVLREIHRLHGARNNLAKVILHGIRITPRTPVHRRCVETGFLSGDEDLLAPRFFRTERGAKARRALLEENERLEQAARPHP